MDYQEIIKGVSFPELSIEQLEALEKLIPVKTTYSYFTMDGPGAWPGGGSLGAGAWYYDERNPKQWKHAEDEVDVRFYSNGQFVHYLRQADDGSIIHVHWEGVEE